MTSVATIATNVAADGRRRISMILLSPATPPDLSPQWGYWTNPQGRAKEPRARRSYLIVAEAVPSTRHPAVWTSAMSSFHDACSDGRRARGSEPLGRPDLV